MCGTCGCSNGKEVTILQPHSKIPEGEKNGHHHHHHDHDHHHEHGHHHHNVIDVEADILRQNDLTAAHNRGFFEARGILALNLVSSPGSGKTSLLERTLTDLKEQMDFFVIEGDQQSTRDADRIDATGVPVVQVNTGKGCHLESEMVHQAVARLNPTQGSVLMIENVGNLVCPSMFDLGEHQRVLIMSITEGEDKPLKYPDMFLSSDICLINKIDLLPYLDFDLDKLKESARSVNPKLKFIELSATTGQGMQEWYSWLRTTAQKLKETNACA